MKLVLTRRLWPPRLVWAWLLVLWVELPTRVLAAAGSYLGADLSYSNVGPGVFYVSLRLYHDCRSPLPAEEMLPCVRHEATGCGPHGLVTPGSSLPLSLRTGEGPKHVSTRSAGVRTLRRTPPPGLPAGLCYARLVSEAGVTRPLTRRRE